MPPKHPQNLAGSLGQNLGVFYLAVGFPVWSNLPLTHPLSLRRSDPIPAAVAKRLPGQ